MWGPSISSRASCCSSLSPPLRTLRATRQRWSVLRHLSIPAHDEPQVTHVKVPCGSNGDIQLDIHSPSISHRVSLPLILYLPPGPLKLPHNSNVSPSHLAKVLGATVVGINYRLDDRFRYPNPIHDVLFGYDWIQQNLLSERTETRYHDSQGHRIGVVGESIGGSLASMLALTECHVKGTRIAAAALHDPMLDWLYPESYLSDQRHESAKHEAKRRNKGTSAELAAEEDDIITLMVKTRSQLFKRPEDWFDPFASPVLFFRSAGLPVPKEDQTLPIDDFDELFRLEAQEMVEKGLRDKVHRDNEDDQGLDAVRDAGEPSTKAVRRAARRYPKVGSGLDLPVFRITTRRSGAFHAQASDFAHRIRRSIIRQDGDVQGSPESAEARAEDQVQHLETSTRGRSVNDTASIAAWLREML